MQAITDLLQEYTNLRANAQALKNEYEIKHRNAEMKLHGHLESGYYIKESPNFDVRAFNIEKTELELVERHLRTKYDEIKGRINAYRIMILDLNRVLAETKIVTNIAKA